MQVKEVCRGEELCCEGGDISLPSAPPVVRVENAGGKHGAALLAGQAAVSIPGYIAFGEVQQVRGTFPTFLELK